MTRRSTALSLALPALILAAVTAGCAADRPAVAETGGAREPDARAMNNTGVNCIETSRIRQTRIRNSSTIDFETRDGQTYRNALPNACPGLTQNGAFTYRTAVGQLCSIDTITVINPGSPIPGPTCGLGRFVPLPKVKAIAPSPTGGSGGTGGAAE